MNFVNGFQKYIVFFVLLGMLCLSTACSRTPKHVQENSLNRVKAIELEQYALKCYDKGMHHLRKNRYELARERFSVAATSAVSPELRQVALNSLKRVEEIIDVRGLNVYARECYEEGLFYLRQNRHELARDKFSIAASSAVSPELCMMAQESMERVDRMVLDRR
ncbi:MAG: hypothetical protein KAI35_02890 [Desulfobulbaceae bacterium]|nr:hypothetical protein [Desulfobulbaceae bacterium]